MFRTIKLKLDYDQDLVDTAILYNQACNMVLEYGFKNKTYNINKLHHGTYRQIRESIPELTSTIVQTARDQAKEILKITKFKKLPIKKNLQIRYDKRSFSFFPNKNMISIVSINGRKRFI